MRAVVLAAGYGTRLERDIRADVTGVYSHLLGCPKPLLPVGALPLASHWMRALGEANARGRHVEHVYVVTNELFHAKFKAWAQDYGSFVTVVNDGTTQNEERLGAIACLQLVVEQCGLQEDHTIVIGGDTLFYEDFNLSAVIDRFLGLQEHRGPDCSLVLSYSCADHETTKFGILEVDETQKVMAFLEKPSAEETSSRRACPCFYVYSKHALPLLKDFLHERKEAPLEARDAPGNFLAWLYPRKPVYTFEVSGRFDVGGLQSYLACHKHFLDKDVSFGSTQADAAT